MGSTEFGLVKTEEVDPEFTMAAISRFNINIALEIPLRMPTSAPQARQEVVPSLMSEKLIAPNVGSLIEPGPRRPWSMQ